MAYTATVTLEVPRAQRISRDYTMIVGQCDITSYHATLAEITGITKYFLSAPRVTVSGPSDNGYLVRWDETSKAFKAYYPTAAQTASIALTDNDAAAAAGVAVYFDEDGTAGQRLQFVSPTNADGTDTLVSVAAAAGGEVANSTDVGVVSFVAVGRH